MLGKFISDRSGNFAVNFAIGSACILGVAGIALETSGVVNTKSDLQQVADAASLAGLVAYRDTLLLGKKGKNSAEKAAVNAARMFVDSHTDEIVGEPSISFDPASVSLSVSLTGHEKAALSKFIGHEGTEVNIVSVAEAKSQSEPVCIIGLDTTAIPAVEFKLSGDFAVPDCSVWSNSTQTTALSGSGSGSATATRFCAVGGVYKSSNFSFSKLPEPNCEPVIDPFESMTVPSVGTCDHTNFSSNSSFVTLNPGVYCGGIQLNAQAWVTLRPGNYYIKDGTFKLTGGSSIVGNGVTIFLLGTGNLAWAGGTVINIKAPTEGAYAGFALFSDRHAALQSSTISGNVSADIEGVVYLPNQNFTFTGKSSSWFPASYTMFIANTMTFSGAINAGFRMDFSSGSIPVPEALVSKILEPRLVR